MLDKKVLIVDDSPSIRMEVRLLLKGIGVSLVEAGGKESMLQGIENSDRLVDLIIMDLTLKHEYGIDLIKYLKSVPKYKNIPILVLTESSEKATIMQALILRITGYMLKPIVKNEFNAKIKEILHI